MPVGLIAVGFEDAMSHLQEKAKKKQADQEIPSVHHVPLPPLFHTECWKLLSIGFIFTSAAAAVAGHGTSIR